MNDKQITFSKLIYFLLIVLIIPTLQFCKSSQIDKGTYDDKNNITPVSYNNDILPLMTQKCTPCHFPDRGKKKMLNTYLATRENIKDILYRVQLPATHEDFMPFKSKREPLTQEEIVLIKNWLSQGMPE
jgi:uncharacterized membrane protein